MSKHCVNKVTGKCAFCGAAADSLTVFLGQDCIGPAGMWVGGGGNAGTWKIDSYESTPGGVLDPSCNGTLPTNAKSTPQQDEPDTSSDVQETFNREAYDQFMKGL